MSDYEDPTRRRPEEDEPSLSEQVGESVRSEDDPLDEQKPTAPLALVMGAYPMILIVLLLIIAAYFFWFRDNPNAENVDEPAARPAEVQPAEDAAPAPAA